MTNQEWDDCNELSDLRMENAVLKDKLAAALAENTKLAEQVQANHRAQQPNEPLTLDELKGMLSEPVWVKSLLDGTVKGAVINNANAAAYVLCGVRYDTFGNYGKTWLAYRSKPEAGENG